MQLVIAEKPSVAQNIAAALGAKKKKDGYIEGDDYLISWCVGHLVQLAEAAVYGEQYRKWSYDSLPILPQNWQYTVAADKGKQFKILKELMHRPDVSEVVNACDAGREGELIFRFVYEVAGCKKPMRRLWISSMEDAAIRSGFDNLKDGRDYDALFASALCRAKADWIIGINATRLFSCLYNRTLNVGRVQTPTLKMLADRDAAISTFKKEKYYHVRLTLSGIEAVSERLSDAATADTLKIACEAAQAVSLLFSVKPQINLITLLLTLILVFLTAFSMAGLAYGISLILPNEVMYETVMNAIVLPIFFLSNALFPVDGMKGFLAFIINANPFTHVISAIRSLLLYGTIDIANYLFVVSLFVLIASISFGWAFYRLNKEMNL